MIRSALTKGQREAVKSPKAAEVLVVSLNREVSIKDKEIESQKETIRATQDELEVWRTKFHDADKDNSILSSKLEFFVGLEIFKFFLSAIGTSYGVNLISSKDNSGWLFIIVSAVIYIGITVWQNKRKSNKARDLVDTQEKTEN